jgi:DNA-binding transcriptional regulator YbjK
MSTRRVDPERRERIIDAALELIAEEGVAGTSHRKVAARADVPLGSMTYHFESMDELLRDAFTLFAERVAQRFELRLAAAGDRAQAVAAVVDLIHHDLLRGTPEFVLTVELYALAARVPFFRTITQGWMERSRAALELHFSADTAVELDAFIEGMSLHRAFDASPASRALSAEAVTRIVG